MSTYENNESSPGGRTRARRSLVICCIVLIVIVVAGVGWRGAQAFLSEGNGRPVRLHVVPNSDSVEDQRLKLAVRDSLRPVVERIMKEERPDWSSYLDLLKRTAEVEVERSDGGYPVRIVTDGRDELRAIRVVIGEGRGANWFCVLVPPLCFADLDPVEKVSPDPGDDSQEEGGIRIAWRWLGRLFGGSSVPFETVGEVDQDDVHADF